MTLGIDQDLIEEVASRLDLRQPNKEALESLVFEMAQHYDVDSRPAPFECVIDSATGVGKTFILAAGIEYYAAAGAVRNFAVIAPGKTIRDKTINQFTPGHPRSLLGPMAAHPVLVTAENFASASVKAALDDDAQVKLYVFTVQSLTAPTTKQGRRTHAFQEGLGSGFYEHLAGLDDLIVFADEHHCYSGPKFSETIYDLAPYAIVGLTATPAKDTPEDQIIYAYPLAAAIAEKFVKTPVIVGRKDDRTDPTTKLRDGLTLLQYKEQALDAYCAEHDLDPVRPVMLIVAQNTTEADEFAEILSSSEIDDGHWADSILTVHSNLKGDNKEKALADLAAVEDPGSPVRIIISVGMLKEGWDVKNVYVVASMRASVSKVLTEQTLGRGLRLPFGAYTGIELLDTLEVVAHERYQDLLRRASVLNEQFIDTRRRAVLRQTSTGQTVAVRQEESVSASVITWGDASPTSEDREPPPEPAQVAASGGAGAAVESVEERTEAAARETEDLQMTHEYGPLDGMPEVRVPVLRMSSVTVQFSLSDITDLEPFRRLGRQLAASPETDLQRTAVSARVVTGRDGLRHTELITTKATDQVEAFTDILPLTMSLDELTDIVANAPIVPPRAGERHAAKRIVKAFSEGLGDDAERILSAYSGRAGARLVKLVTDEHRRHLGQPRVEQVVELKPLDRMRQSKRTVSNDRTGRFQKSLAYDSWQKCLYGVDWFDSEPERHVANMADDSPDVTCWVRLHTGELPILWRSDGREYNADLIVVETNGSHWVVEVKSDRDVATDEVRAKREAALRWVNHVNDSDAVTVPWSYILVSESDINDAQNSWPALKQLGSAS